MLSFTTALPLFLLAVTVTTLFIQILDKPLKNNTSPRINKCDETYVKRLSWVIYLISLSGAIFAWFTLAKVHMLYVFYVLAPLIPTVLLLFQWKCGKIPLIIATLWLWYFMLEIPPIFKDYLFISEGVHMVRSIVFDGMFTPEKAHNSAYALFPTVAFMQATLSLVTGIPWYSYFAVAPMLIAWALSLGLLIYPFTREIQPETSNEKSLPTIFLALTPQIYLFGILFTLSYQIPAMIIWLITILFFMKYINKSKSLEDLLLSILTFIAAILTHPSSIVALGYIFIYFFIIILSKKTRFTPTSSEKFNNKKIQMIIAIFTLIFAIRVIYDVLYITYVLKLGSHGIRRLIDFMFGYEEPSIVASPSIYDASGIPFYQAYTWSLTAGIALGKILYDFAFKKSINVNELSSILTAIIFTGFGFIWGVLVRGVSTQLYRSAYVTFVLYIPVAVALSSRLRSRVARGFFLLMIILASTMILTDPVASLTGRFESRGIPPSVVDVWSSSSDITQASIIIDKVKDLSLLDSIGLYSIVQLEYERVTAYGRTIHEIYNPIADAIYKLLYIKGFTKKDKPIYMPYIVTQTQFNTSKFSIVYNSVKYYLCIEN